jgi:hypothetical protein
MKFLVPIFILVALLSGNAAELERAYFDVTISSGSNARSRATELKLTFITFFRGLPAAAMSHQI